MSRYHLNEWQFKRLRIARRSSTSPKSLPYNKMIILLFENTLSRNRLQLVLVDAYSTVAYNHPSILLLNALSFDRVHHLSLYEQFEKILFNKVIREDLPFTPVMLYGCPGRNIWPTREHGTNSRLPPHIQTRNDNSKFSPPQTYVNTVGETDQQFVILLPFLHLKKSVND